MDLGNAYGEVDALTSKLQASRARVAELEARLAEAKAQGPVVFKTL